MKSLATLLLLGLSLGMAGEKKQAEKKVDTKATPVEKAAIKTEASKKDYKKAFPNISQKDLVKAIKDKSVILVDANGTESYNKAHIPGAINFKSESFAKGLPKDKKSLIVAYCGGPGCAAWNKAADDLEAKGYKNIQHFGEGIKGWVKAGLETEKVAETKEVKKKG